MESGGQRRAHVHGVHSGSGTPGASRSGDEHHSTIVSIEEQADDAQQLRLLSDSMRSLLHDTHFRYPLISHPLRRLSTTLCFSDVMFLVGENGRRVPAHRCILAARCAPFYSMFMSDMRESQDGGELPPLLGPLPRWHHSLAFAEIVIPNIEPDVFCAIIEFLYTGTLELHVASVFQIYKAADQYLLEDVKLACRSFIHQSLTVDHALVLLENARSCKFMDIYQASTAAAAASHTWVTAGLPRLRSCQRLSAVQINVVFGVT